ERDRDIRGPRIDRAGVARAAGAKNPGRGEGSRGRRDDSADKAEDEPANRKCGNAPTGQKPSPLSSTRVTTLLTSAGEHIRGGAKAATGNRKPRSEGPGQVNGRDRDRSPSRECERRRTHRQDGGGE